jgi:hypothetical protein
MNTIEAFAALVQKERTEQVRKQYQALDAEDYGQVFIVPGRKYTKIDVGPEGNRSGRYMVDEAGNIYGIKGYGVVHKGHRYGTLDTIHKWYWGGYTAVPR